ncbi:hypothetical protein [Thalassospira australica]|uniref:hypothetical protein n=1 Tax=Thalassospira australica TaxID=1528106 RepID=UPI00384C5EBE
MAAVIHVKLTGEGDFGPVDLECAIPPARLPLVMAALFGSPNGLRAGAAGAVDHAASSASSGPASSFSPDGRQFPVMARPDRSGSVIVGKGTPASESAPGQGGQVPDTQGSDAGLIAASGQANRMLTGQNFGGAGLAGGSDAIDPANFLIGYVGNLGDLIARLQPRGFAETILIAAIWLHYRDGRSFVTRDDIRRLLRRQEHLRMPRNFGRDFHSAITRGYIEPVDGDGGFAATGSGYQWFRDACIK